MNKHEEYAHEQAHLLVNQINVHGFCLPEVIRDKLHDYIETAEATEKELEEIKLMIKEIGDSVDE